MRNKRFEEYFLKYKNLIIRLVMERTGDYQAAQEICQQVFVAFYTNMDGIADDLVKAWLMKCAMNAVIDYYRRLKIKNEIFEKRSLHESGNVLKEESLDFCEDRIVQGDLIGKILQEVKVVNQNWYEVLFLRCVDGLTFVEMSRRLKVPEAVLRARLHRAREYIRRRFGEEYTNL